MELSSYPAQSLTFSGVGAEGQNAHAAAEALAAALNAWAAAHEGQHLLQLSVAATPAASGAGLAAILVHTAGANLPVALAEEVASVVESAETDPMMAEFERIIGRQPGRSRTRGGG
jgi:hypothetical protein